MDSVQETTASIIKFRDERDWGQFHTPRNLTAALAIEASELQEALLWKSDQEVTEFLETGEGRQKIEEELGDVLIFALLLSHSCAIDPIKAVQGKLALNEAKYPIERARGVATKYSHL